MNKLALGTVQFGLDYGVANKTGQVDAAEITRILTAAKQAGVTTLDTAAAYGLSEKRLGEQDLAGFQLISKVSAVPNHEDAFPWLKEQCEQCLQRLKISQLEGFLLHQPEQLLSQNGKEIYLALQEIKKLGLVKKIGISVYSPADLDALKQYFFDIYQGPYNLLDTRFKKTGWLDRIQNQGAEFHARSAFLQGLLVMPANERPEKFDAWQAIWAQWQQWLATRHLNATTVCLKFSLQEPLIKKVVVGVDSSQQWQELLAIAAMPPITLPTEFNCEDERLLNPALWSAL